MSGKVVILLLFRYRYFSAFRLPRSSGIVVSPLLLRLNWVILFGEPLVVVTLVTVVDVRPFASRIARTLKLSQV